jgi:hypothetical protein
MATGNFTLKQVNQAIAQGAWSGYIAPRWVEYLVVAGGGGGGAGGGGGGGGGAGGLLTGIVTVAAGTSYTVTVGGGGTAGASANGDDGVASVFGSISATGGGGGGWTARGRAGGSGGGNGANTGGNPAGSGTAGQGNGGGISDGDLLGGGGGGAGTVGLAGVSVGGAGGAGIASAISGTVIAYSGGGGGGATGATAAGAGGVGGGGIGGTGSGVGTVGSSNTGGGGGAGGGGNVSGGTGGSGIVVVRYPGNVQFYTGGAITYVNGYIVHIFYASGTLAPTAPAVVATDYQISRSLRFNSADSAYLNRTPASASNQKTWTWSGWVKRSSLPGTSQVLFGTASAGSNANSSQVRFNTDNKLEVFEFLTASYNFNYRTTQVFRDVSSWYHIMAVLDTTQATAGNRIKIYVNGVQVTAFDASTDPTLNLDGLINSTVAHGVGRGGAYADLYFSGYMTEINFVDGQALTPSSFGATNTNTGVWGPKAYTGTYGTNGFYLNFSDNSNTTAATLGKDYSGNGNNWTPNNFSVTAGAGNDSLVDVPTNYGTDYGVGGAVRGNYATWNALGNNKPNLTNGNLDADGQDLKTAISTMGVSSGKWYWEILIGSGTDTPNMGVTSFANDNADPGVYLGAGRSYVSSGGGSGVYKAYTATSTVADSDFSNANTVGATIGFALDCDAGTLSYYVNNVLGYTDSTVAKGTLLFPMTCNFNSTTNAYRNTSVNFGQRAFAYTAPAGFKALCTQNLPTPTIGSSPTTLASQFFNTVLWTGTGTQTRSITGLNFQPDFTWMKIRADTPQDNQLYDAVRGAGPGKSLATNTTAAEGSINGFLDSDYGYLSSFDSGGFSVNDGAVATTGGYVNFSGRTYVAWNWKAGSSTVSNTAGTITSQVNANPTAGFSIVTYTGNSTAGATRGHGLNALPKMMFIKGRAGTYGVDNWHVYHASLPNTQGLALNTTGAATTSEYFWNNTSPTPTLFTTSTGASNNDSGTTYVAYCFAEIAGFSAFGSYTGNGSADGPFVFTGFRPAFVMVKRSSSSGTNWQILDTKRSTYNVMADYLYASATNTEGYDTGVGIDSLSNGFKIRGTDGNTNTSTATYVYMAFAETPFKYSLAR